MAFLGIDWTFGALLIGKWYSASLLTRTYELKLALYRKLEL
jgi:hypothetical protein